MPPSRWTDVAIKRFARTLQWGEELENALSKARPGTRAYTQAIYEIEDWRDSTAFFINFLRDGNCDKELATLGCDPQSLDPIVRIDAFDAPRARAEFTMWLAMLREWSTRIIDEVAVSEGMHPGVLKILSGYDGWMWRAALQARLEIETPDLTKLLDQLVKSGVIEFSSTSDRLRLTNLGRTCLQAKQDGLRDEIFFSYAREDVQSVRRVHRLLAQAGFTTWVDYQNILPGQDWSQETAMAIKRAMLCLVFLSNSCGSKAGFVNKEIGLILEKVEHQPQGRVVMIPIRLDECTIPHRLERWHCIEYSGPDWKADLLKGIRSALYP